jgi:sugar lactone lactonase YvrE
LFFGKLEREVLMRKYFFYVVVMLILAGSPALAQELKVGMKATDWSYKDAKGNVYTMESWSGRVLLVNYVDPDTAELNEHFTDAMKKASD